MLSQSPKRVQSTDPEGKVKTCESGKAFNSTQTETACGIIQICQEIYILPHAEWKDERADWSIQVSKKKRDQMHTANHLSHMNKWRQHIQQCNSWEGRRLVQACQKSAIEKPINVGITGTFDKLCSPHSSPPPPPPARGGLPQGEICFEVRPQPRILANFERSQSLTQAQSRNRSPETW